MSSFDPKRAGLVLAATVCAGALLAASPALAVHKKDLFELEGNALDEPVAGDDWGQTDCDPVTGFPDPDSCGYVVGPSFDTNVTGGSAIDTTFIKDNAATNDNIFTGGGSKDDLDVRSWAHTTGSVPDKTDIVDAFAAAYRDGSNNLVVYFGATLFAANGDANLGFWFFKNRIVQSANGSFTCPGVPAGDTCHEVGDIFVEASFSNGGSTVSIQVLEWVGSGGNVDPNNTLRTIDVFGGRCSPDLTSGDVACAVVNATVQDAPDTWGYAAKSPVDFTGSSPFTEPNTVADDFPATTFFEGGINITELLQGVTSEACFATFLAETRSSDRVRAQLKDFALGEFQDCGLEATKVCELGGDLDNEGNPTGIDHSTGEFVYNVSGTVTSTGLGTVFNVEVIDTLDTPEDTSDDVVLATLGPVDTTTAWGPVELRTDSPIATNSVYAQGTVTSDPTSETVTSSIVAATDGCPTPVVSPSLSVTKVCRACLTVADSTVNVIIVAEGQVCNTGDVALTNVTVTDDAGTPSDTGDDVIIPIGNLPVDDGVTNDHCAPYDSGYTPATVNSTDPTTASFSDTVTATAESAISGFTVDPAMAPATCELCPDDPTDPGLSITCPALP